MASFEDFEGQNVFINGSLFTIHSSNCNGLKLSFNDAITECSKLSPNSYLAE